MTKPSLQFAALGAVALTGCAAQSETTYRYVPHSTAKVAQITGDWDIGWQMLTPTKTGVNHGVYFTDLGIPFKHRGRLGFAFGDTVSSLAGPASPDFISYTESGSPEDFALSFLKSEDGSQPHRIDIPGIREADYEVPSSVLSIDDRLHMVFTTGSDGFGPEAKVQMRRSVMAVSDDDGRTWDNLYTLSQADGDDFTNTRFINVAMLRQSAGVEVTHLPEAVRHDPVFVWGTGEYRKSRVYLAVAAADQLDQPGSLHYWVGLGGDGLPQWSSEEADAAPIFDADFTGEVSAIYLPQIQRYAITYVIESLDVSERGTFLRFTENPWRGYGAPQKIFDPWRDRGYTEFMHVSDSFGRLDNVHDPGREFTWGGEYGAYLIEPFTRYENGQLDLFYTLSTWNPYQVMLMRSSFGSTDATGPKTYSPRREYSMPGADDWHPLTEGVFFRPRLSGAGLPFVQMEGNGGLGDTGAMWMPVPTDPELTRIEFEVWHGDAEVVLVEAGPAFPDHVEDVEAFYTEVKAGRYGRVARVAKGLRDTRFRRAALWALQPYEREGLRLLVIDPWKTNWGGGHVSRIAFTNAAHDRFDGLQRGASSSASEVYPPFASAASTLAFDRSGWVAQGDADRFIIEHKYDRRYVSSLSSKGFEATGLLAYPLSRPEQTTLIEFYVAGTDGQVLLVERTPETESALRAGDWAEVVSDPDLVLKQVDGNGGWMPGKQVVWELSPETEHDYLFVIADTPAAGGERFVSVTEPRLYYPGSGDAAKESTPEPEITSRLVAAGSHDWAFSDDEFCGFYFDQGRGWVTTFGPNGDDDVGYLTKNLPPMNTPEVGSVTFGIAGTGGRVYLLEGEFPAIPADVPVSDLRRALEAGEYGQVLQTADGHESIVPKTITWDTTGQLAQGGRLVILDDVAEVPWAFLTVSDFELHQP